MVTDSSAGPSQLEALASRWVRGVRVVDLRDVSWIDPLHLVGVAAMAHASHRASVPFRLLGPSGQLASYAARMRLGTIIDKFGGSHELPKTRERDRHDSLLEITELTCRSDAERMAGLVHDRVYPLDARSAAALHNGLAEIGANVCDHAQSTGFMAAQAIGQLEQLRFAVADCGVGLLGTLVGRGAYDDRSALGLAISGESRLKDEDATRGCGLPNTIEQVSALGGAVFLASGTATVQLSATDVWHSETEPRWVGTLLEGRVPASRHALQRLSCDVN